MKQLATLVASPERRVVVVDDCVSLVESEVRAKSGITGFAVKTVFGVVQALKPRMIHELVEALLDEFIAQLEPFYAEFQGESAAESIERYLTSRGDRVAESLLAVTDRRAERSSHRGLVSAYQKLRPKGKAHVLAAVPGVGRLLERQLRSGAAGQD